MRLCIPKEYQYREEKQAQKNFEEGMKALFHVPKNIDKKKSRKKRPRSLPADAAFPTILAARLKPS